MTQPFRLRPMTTADLDTVLLWRNRPEVRANMYNRHEISPEEHRRFFSHGLDDATRRYLICIDRLGTPLGLANFTGIDVVNGTAVLGSYVGDPLKAGGVGAWLEYLALEAAFEDLPLEKVSCEVLGWNHRTVGFHQKFGFVVEGVFRVQIVRDEARHDVFRLGILRSEWEARRPEVQRLLGMRDVANQHGSRHE